MPIGAQALRMSKGAIRLMKFIHGSVDSKGVILGTRTIRDDFRISVQNEYSEFVSDITAKRCFARLVEMGMLRRVKKGVYKMHPYYFSKDKAINDTNFQTLFSRA